MNQSCQNTVGTFRCHCNAGFYRQNDTACSDINECTSEGICDSNAECTNVSGSYLCQCKDGFIGNGYLCQAKDYCERNACKFGTCSSNITGYTCHCFAGYELVNNQCVDIDECSNENACIMRSNS